jgi:molybdopterin-synthase adenylyltransferase
MDKPIQPALSDRDASSATKWVGDRYRRQTAFAGIGKAGQTRLAEAKVVVVGVGALGSVIAERLVRAGVGLVRLIDRDWVEWDNLPRQTLFIESDAVARVPKAVAAANHLRAINSEATIESVVADLIPNNASELLKGFNLILDGTDNFETRFLINDASLEYQVPWIHGGCVGASGQGLVCIPGQTACFRCLMPEPMPADQQATCDSAGVVGPAITIVAGWQAMEAIKLLSGAVDAVCRALVTFDFWENEIRYIRLEPHRSGDGCPCCFQGKRDFLSGTRFSMVQVLCGRNAVQLHNPTGQPIDLARLGQRLANLGAVNSNPFLVRFESVFGENQPFSITVFRDGRGIVSGTEDPVVARQLFATWIGQ